MTNTLSRRLGLILLLTPREHYAVVERVDDLYGYTLRPPSFPFSGSLKELVPIATARFFIVFQLQ